MLKPGGVGSCGKAIMGGAAGAAAPPGMPGACVAPVDIDDGESMDPDDPLPPVMACIAPGGGAAPPPTGIAVCGTDGADGFIIIEGGGNGPLPLGLKGAAEPLEKMASSAEGGAADDDGADALGNGASQSNNDSKEPGSALFAGSFATLAGDGLALAAGEASKLAKSPKAGVVAAVACTDDGEGALETFDEAAGGAPSVIASLLELELVRFLCRSDEPDLCPRRIRGAPEPSIFSMGSALGRLCSRLLHSIWAAVAPSSEYHFLSWKICLMNFLIWPTLEEEGLLERPSSLPSQMDVAFLFPILSNLSTSSAVNVAMEMDLTLYPNSRWIPPQMVQTNVP